MRGDFTGFSFDGVHCSKLGITHVSTGDRYEEELFPEVKDKTIEIPNNHGEYYYGSTYGTRSFEIEIAFDSVTEVQFRNIRRLFGTRKICELIFDERPYKVYYAKIEDPIQMSYVCFDEDEKIIGGTIDEGGVRWITDESTCIRRRESKTPYIRTGNKQRIYKGEAKIKLICYFPFERQLFKTLDLYSQAGSHWGNLDTVYTNVNEWAESSGLLTEEERVLYKIDEVESITSTVYSYAIPVYNPGDLNVGFCLYLPVDRNGKICPKDGQNVIIINGDENTLCLSEVVRKNSHETGVIINTTNHLIEGVNLSSIAHLHNYRTPSWQTSGAIYNEYIAAGDFPYIKRSDWRMDDLQYSQAIYVSCSEDNGDIGIYYNYLYF